MPADLACVLSGIAKGSQPFAQRTRTHSAGSKNLNIVPQNSIFHDLFRLCDLP